MSFDNRFGQMWLKNMNSSMCFSHRRSKGSKERMKELRKARRAGGRDAAERREGNEKASLEFKL